MTSLKEKKIVPPKNRTSVQVDDVSLNQKNCSPTQTEEKVPMLPNANSLKIDNAIETQNEMETQLPTGSSDDSLEAENMMGDENFSYEDEGEAEQNSDEFFDDEDQSPCEARDFSKNQIALNFSWSLMNQVRQMAKMEGVSAEDLLTELVAEGVAKRVFEDQSRPIPSHLMTRTGYVHSDSEHNPPQPHLSHHTMNNNRQQMNNNSQNRNRYNPQQKSPSQQHRDPNSRSYGQNNVAGNNRSPGNANSGSGYNRNQYGNNNQQQRFPRNNTNTNSNNGNSGNGGYQNTPRTYDENSNTGQNGNNYKQRNYNKR